MKTDIAPEPISNSMEGVLLDFDDELSMLRAGRFGQVQTANDENWSSFYWATPAAQCGYRVGCHYGVDGAPRQSETLGVLLMQPGLYSVDGKEFRVTASSLSSEGVVVNMGQAAAKQLLRSQRSALALRARHGADSVAIAIWPRDIKIKNTPTNITVPAEKYFTKAGRYEVLFDCLSSARAELQIESVALLKNGVEVARDVHPGEAGPLLDKDNCYTLDVKAFSPGAKYSFRFRASAQNPSAASGTVVLRGDV